MAPNDRLAPVERQAYPWAFQVHVLGRVLETAKKADLSVFASRNKKLVETSASLLVTSALLLGARTLLGAHVPS